MRYQHAEFRQVIEYLPPLAHGCSMKRPQHLFAVAIAIVMTVCAGTAQAACYADYKAKRDGPLRLHYGVMEVAQSACRTPSRAEAEVRARLRDAGWELLNVVSVFDEVGLDQRKESAAEFFLRF